MFFYKCATVLLIFFNLGLNNGSSKEGCSLDIRKNANEKFLPVLLHNLTTKYILMIPEKGIINLKSGEGITLACPGRRNLLAPTNSNTTYATCVQGSTLNIFGRHWDFQNVLCQKAVHGDIQETQETCGDGRGKIINIGYPITRQFFKTLIRVCYDGEEGNTIYTEHVIHGKEVKYSSRISDRPSFSVSGLGPGISANVVYKRAFQKSTFNKLLGSARVADEYINSKSYLARGHLSPDADFLFASSQFTSYFYINTCPQWQSINGGNWVSVENSVRKAAEYYKDSFVIITGTYDILELPNARHNPTDIFLVSGTKLPVSKFMWKIMYNRRTQEGIAFIIVNNPFLDAIHQDHVLCMDLCERYGWGTTSWQIISKGYVYCCDVNEFSEIVDTVPYLEVEGVLKGIS